MAKMSWDRRGEAVAGQKSALKLCAVGVVAVAVAALIGCSAAPARQANSAAPAGPAQSAVPGPQGTVYAGDRYGFKAPSAVAVGGGSLWVASLYYKGPEISPATTAVPTLTDVPTG